MLRVVLLLAVAAAAVAEGKMWRDEHRYRTARSLFGPAAEAVKVASTDDTVTAVPGLDSLPFSSFAGHIDVGKRGQLFYWGATEDAANNPVVFWMNGGRLNLSCLAHVLLLTCFLALSLSLGHHRLQVLVALSVLLCPVLHMCRYSDISLFVIFRA